MNQTIPNKTSDDVAREAFQAGLLAGVVGGIGHFVFALLAGKDVNKALAEGATTGFTVGAGAAAGNLIRNAVGETDMSKEQVELAGATAAMIVKEAVRLQIEHPGNYDNPAFLGH